MIGKYLLQPMFQKVEAGRHIITTLSTEVDIPKLNLVLKGYPNELSTTTWKVEATDDISFEELKKRLEKLGLLGLMEIKEEKQEIFIYQNVVVRKNQGGEMLPAIRPRYVNGVQEFG